MSELKCNADRLWSNIMSLAEIGATPGGGVGRIALTETDRQARDRFVQWCKAAGCEVRVDAMGNIFARRAGADADAPPVMTGSHLDTQPLGGKFDGIYGVLAGLEVICALNDADVRTRAPLDVTVWTDEEGVRFAGGCVASGVFAGAYELEYGLGLADSDGITMGEALQQIGYAGEEPVGGYPVDSFFEAHIEQGPILEAEQLQIGVVLGAQGQLCFEVVVTGEEGHAGTLPMTLRKDAMVGSARMIAALNELAFTYEPHPVITVGHVRVRPNSRNTIPGQVVFTIDVRHPHDDTLERAASDMASTCREIADSGGFGLEFERVSERHAVSFDPQCIDLVRASSARLGIASRDMHSGAGHDACHLARATPTGMIFVPCKDGISHNERESARPEDLAAGCDVLMQAMITRAGVV